MEEIVHIVPIGWEIDRAVEPIKKMKAHRVYLLHRIDHQLNYNFVKKVEDQLKKEKIEVIDIQLESQGRFEELLFHISRIIVTEASKKSRIHINISACGKIAAATASLAGMYHSDKIGSMYYVEPSSYSVAEENPQKSFEECGLSVGMEGIYYPPYFNIGRPNPRSIFVLTYLYENGPQSYKSIINALKRVNFEPFKHANIPVGTSPKKKGEAKKALNLWTMKLKRLILNDLVKEKYVELEPSYHGRKLVVHLTKNGEYAAILSGEVTKLQNTDEG